MKENFSVGGERDWLDDHSQDVVYKGLAAGKYGQVVAGGEVPQNAEYVMRHDAEEIKSNQQQDKEIKKITEADMVNPESYWGSSWIQNAKVMHHHYTGQPYGEGYYEQDVMDGGIPTDALPPAIQGMGSGYTGSTEKEKVPMTDADYAEWALEFMGWFNYNIGSMGIQTAKLSMMPDYDPETGMTGDKGGNPYGAMYNLMTMYDQKDITWNGTARMFKGLATDPSTYVGLGTLGLAFLGRQSVKHTSKKGMMELLRRNIMKNTGKAQFGLAVAEGGLYGGIDGSLRQSVGIQAGAQDGFSLEKLGKDTLTGMVLGGGLQLGIKGLTELSRTTNDRALDKIYDTADEAQANLVGWLSDQLQGGYIGKDSKLMTDVDQYDVAVNAPVKKRATANAKMNRKKYTDVSQLKDIVRTAVTVDNPADARDVVNLIKNNFDIVEDDGFQKYTGGYFDYKINVKTPEGNTAEIQILSRSMATAKKELHPLYEESRKIAPAVEAGTATPDQVAEYERLLSESDIIAAKALVADMGTWSDVYNDIGFDMTTFQQLADTAAQMPIGGM